MAAPSTTQTIPNNVTITGGLSCNTFNPPNGCITDAAVLTGTNIAAGKVYHRFNKSYRQPSATTAFVESQVVHVARTAGNVISFDVGAVVANIGAATVIFDMLKNGATVLTAQITLTSATAAYALLSGTIAGGSATCVAGDVFELKIVSATVGGGTLAKGVFCRFVTEEQGT
jgi:hypothetical protein